MAITANDIEYRLANPSASAGNQLAQINPAASLGGFLSASIWHGSGLHDLFGPVTGDQNRDLDIQYRCLFLINKHATLTWQLPIVWLTDLGTGITLVAIGVDPTPASPLTAAAAQARTTDAATTPPADVVFSAPASKGSGLSLGDLPPGHCRAIWLRRAATATAAAVDEDDEPLPDGFSIEAEGDSA